MVAIVEPAGNEDDDALTSDLDDYDSDDEYDGDSSTRWRVKECWFKFTNDFTSTFTLQHVPNLDGMCFLLLWQLWSQAQRPTITALHLADCSFRPSNEAEEICVIELMNQLGPDMTELCITEGEQGVGDISPVVLLLPVLYQANFVTELTLEGISTLQDPESPIVHALQSCFQNPVSKLKELTFDICNLHTSTWQAVAEAMADLSTLRNLGLVNCALTHQQLNAIVDGLQANDSGHSTLTEFIFQEEDFEDLEDDGELMLSAMVRLLRGSPSLEDISYGGRHFGRLPHCKKFFHALASHPVLRQIDFETSEITPEHADALFQALEQTDYRLGQKHLLLGETHDYTQVFVKNLPKIQGLTFLTANIDLSDPSLLPALRQNRSLLGLQAYRKQSEEFKRSCQDLWTRNVQLQRLPWLLAEENRKNLCAASWPLCVEHLMGRERAGAPAVFEFVASTVSVVLDQDKIMNRKRVQEF